MAGKPDLWMPLFPADYLADTAHLSTTEHGAYFLLLMAAWMRGGRLPADEGQLRTIARLDKRAWTKHRDVLLAFLTRDGDVYVQKRLLAEYERAVDVNGKRSEIGRLGGQASAAARRAKATDGSTDGSTDGATVGATVGVTAGQANHQAKSNTSTSTYSDAPHRASIDAGAVVFSEGLRLLTDAGVKEAAARSFLGKLRAAHGDDAVAAAVREAAPRDLSDPGAWLAKRLNGGSRPGNGIGRRGAFDVDLQQKDYSADLPTGSDR